jgi:hypothetical protein
VKYAPANGVLHAAPVISGTNARRAAALELQTLRGTVIAVNIRDTSLPKGVIRD